MKGCSFLDIKILQILKNIKLKVWISMCAVIMFLTLFIDIFQISGKLYLQFNKYDFKNLTNIILNIIEFAIPILIFIIAINIKKKY